MFYNSAWVGGGMVRSEFKTAGLKSTFPNSMKLWYSLRSENTSDCKPKWL